MNYSVKTQNKVIKQRLKFCSYLKFKPFKAFLYKL